jgi:hypothetical protein
VDVNPLEGAVGDHSSHARAAVEVFMEPGIANNSGQVPMSLPSDNYHFASLDPAI